MSEPPRLRSGQVQLRPPKNHSSQKLVVDPAFHAKDRDSAEKLRGEVRGFLRHSLAAQPDLCPPPDPNRNPAEPKVALPANHRRKRDVHFALIAQILF